MCVRSLSWIFFFFLLLPGFMETVAILGCTRPISCHFLMEWQCVKADLYFVTFFSFFWLLFFKLQLMGVLFVGRQEERVWNGCYICKLHALSWPFYGTMRDECKCLSFLLPFLFNLHFFLFVYLFSFGPENETIIIIIKKKDNVRKDMVLVVVGWGLLGSTR